MSSQISHGMATSACQESHGVTPWRFESGAFWLRQLADTPIYPPSGRSDACCPKGWQKELKSDPRLRIQKLSFTHESATSFQRALARSSFITAISTSRFCCSRSSWVRGLVLNSRSTLEHENQHEVGNTMHEAPWSMKISIASIVTFIPKMRNENYLN